MNEKPVENIMIFLMQVEYLMKQFLVLQSTGITSVFGLATSLCIQIMHFCQYI